ncbi:hypothetical protein DAPPUDRAFT_334965 [Daphnia pulex]|uniref:Uncharacterized protein n=1 Tax=Daphnia pulex TaxID=6669 RepID=E9HWS3_DAPPU|nr:hypothetical protein DAPPUDRAFT_334965 [Daphnia pulex]|eukprot:EFX63807.1 hypothetical protein DAPPUDRAFT_334965 [Daphnia pulex]
MTDHPPDSDDLTPTGKQDLASDDSSQAYGADHRLYFLVNGRIITINGQVPSGLQEVRHAFDKMRNRTRVSQML